VNGYKYLDKYFRAVIPFPTCLQSTTHLGGTFPGMESPASFKAVKKRVRKTFAMANSNKSLERDWANPWRF